MKNDPIRIAICICTFRRAHIAETLGSLATIDIDPSWNIRVVVADNDTAPSAQQPVLEAAKGLPFPVEYIHAPAGNISLARNACLDAVASGYCIFIDDDEVVTSKWLAELIRTKHEANAAVVLGPVRAHYIPGVPAWLPSLDLHSTFPVFVNGEIQTGYTCNTLMDLDAPSIAGLRFDLLLGQSGGEDSVFFSSAWRSGAKIAYAQDAWVEEVVPLQRSTLGWLANRKFRSGQTHARTVQPAKRLQVFFAALLKGLYCSLRMMLSFYSPAAWRRWLIRGVLHFGVLSGILGMRSRALYGLHNKRSVSPS